MILLVLLVALLLPSWAQATTYYVATNGSNSYTCTQAQSESTPRLTISSGLSCLVGGDTLVIKSGTYTNQNIYNPPAGSDSAYTIIRGEPDESRPIIDPNGTSLQIGVYCDNGSSCHHIEIRHLEISTAYNHVKLHGTSTIGYAHHLRFIDNVMHDSVSTGFITITSTSGYTGGDHLIQDNVFYRTGVGEAGYAPGHNTIYNPGNRTIVERNTFRNLANGIGIWYSGKVIQNVIIRDNLFYDIGLTTTDTWQQGNGSFAGIHISSSGGGHQIYRNIIYHSGEQSTFSGIRVWSASSTDVNYIYNNTIYDLQNTGAKAINVYVTSGTHYVKNNIAYQAQVGIQCSVACVSSNNLTTNPSFKDATNADFALTASSTSAINAGTNVDLPFCDTAPDIGAHEVCGPTYALISTHYVDVLFGPARPPVQAISGTTGWSVSCTGAGCGTPSLVSAIGLSGSSNIVRLDVSGLSGGNCAAGQTFTVSFNGSTGSVTDSANIGGTETQDVHSFSSFPVTNQCPGSTPTPPATPYIIYLLDGDATDTSGGGRNGTVSGGTWVDGINSQGFQTTAAADTYIEAPYFSGVNPSTQALSVAYWIYVEPENTALTKNVGGVPLGTNQRFHVYTSGGSWRMAFQSQLGSASEFPVASGWTRVCVTMATSTATLHINGQAGAITNASVFTYTSFSFAGNYRLGLPSGILTSLAGQQIYDDFKIWQAAIDCAEDYTASQPPPDLGTLSAVASRWYGAKTVNGARVALAANNTAISLGQTSSVAYVVQTNCTGCSWAGQRLYYTCAACASGGAVTPVPATATADGIAFYGQSQEAGLLVGDHGSALTGSPTLIAGQTQQTADAIPTFGLATGEAVVNTYLITFINAPLGAAFQVFPQEQNGNALSSVTPTGGLTVTIVSNSSGF